MSDHWVRTPCQRIERVADVKIIVVLYSMEVTECAHDTVASLGEVLTGVHDGGAELPPVGGVVWLAAEENWAPRQGASLLRGGRGGPEAKMGRTVIILDHSLAWALRESSPLEDGCS